MLHFRAVWFVVLLFAAVSIGTLLEAQPVTIEFDASIDYPMNYPINHSQVDDVDGDGTLDILAVVGEPGVDPLLLVMLGAGNGVFGPAITSPITVNFPWSLTVADFDEDGNADVVVADLINSQFSYLSGNGDGSFTLEPRLIPGWGGGNPQILAVDVDEDDHVDLVAGDFFGSRLLVAWGTGIDDPIDAFDTLTAIDVTGFPMSIDVEDLDGDGDLDLCCGFNSGSGGGIATVMATGNRTFGAEQRLVAGLVGAHWSVDAVDLDGGSPEIVTVSEGDGFLGIYPLQGGVPQNPTLIPVSDSSRHVEIADLDLDGIQDLVVRDPGDGNFQIFQGLGGLGFQSVLEIDGPNSFSGMQLVDIDEDGLLDIYAGNYSASSSSFHRNATQVGDIFIRADVNTDGGTNVADAIFLLAFLFSGGVDPSCLDAADTNDDGTVNISDAITLLAVLFSGGGPTPDPVGTCGLDPTDDALDCQSPGNSCL
ncbi:MAG: FG-GAP-like repeat-containing protein [Planctomycetota bacterium]|nr:FG-GAP-like repeat-containing protein [Planctomycetota bacterium]